MLSKNTIICIYLCVDPQGHVPVIKVMWVALGNRGNVIVLDINKQEQDLEVFWTSVYYNARIIGE